MNYLSALKPFANTPTQWDAFVEMIDMRIDLQQKLLEQSTDLPTINRAQGQIACLRKMKQLRDEVNAAK